jgi:fructose-1-phosphate kinase PfkB-like protein
LDADGEPFHEGIAAHPFFVKPNEKEASRLLGRSVETDEEAIGAAREILPLMSAGGFVLLSRGEKGAVLACESGTWMGRSPKVEVQSTVGCGDAMLAGMVWALSTGSELPDAFQWSLATGAAVATTRRATIEGAAMVKDLCPQAEVTRI